MDKPERYLKIEPENREDFLKAMAAHLKNQFESTKAISHKVARLSGVPYPYEKEKEAEKVLRTAGFYARLLLGEIGPREFSQECVRTCVEDKRSVAGFLKTKIIMLAKGSDIRKMLDEPAVIQKDVATFKAALRIARRENISLEKVIKSEQFSSELRRAVYKTIQDKRREFLSVLDGKDFWFPSDELDIKDWATDELVDPKEMEYLKESLRQKPRTALSKAHKVALIIANEEDLVKIYGDSENQKLKREKLYEILEYLKSKNVA